MCSILNEAEDYQCYQNINSIFEQLFRSPRLLKNANHHEIAVLLQNVTF